MRYIDLFERAASHVRRHGVNVTFRRGGPASPAAVVRAFAAADLAVPQGLVDFYAAVGDGLEFSWDGPGERGPSAFVEFPPVAQVVAEYADRRHWVDEWERGRLPTHMTEADQRRTLAGRVRNWLPILGDGSGCKLSLDAAVRPAPVVFCPVAWMDSMPAVGFRLGTSLGDFLADWSRACFQAPNWWPEAFDVDGGGVDWKGDGFSDQFRLAAG